MSRDDDKYLKLLRSRYRAASKKEKGVILDEFVKTTGYSRKHAIALLNGKRDCNDQLYRYSVQEQITFTRGRAGKKNDSAYAEQKNWSVVRRAVGYYRYDTPEQLDLLDRLYAVMHFYVNFFLPVMKLKEKTRVGSKVKKTYDDPQTPYARVLSSPDVSEEQKAQLRETYALLDLVQLRQQIDDLQSLLFNSVSML